MATSGTTTFTVTRDQIIESALRSLAVLEEGATPAATTLENSSFALNLILKKWQSEGIKLWTVVEYTLPLVNNQTSYTIGPSSSYNLNADKPLRLIQAYLRNISVSPNIDMPMTLISEQEYNILGAKKSTGNVNTVFYKPWRDYGELKVFLTPNTSTATNYELHLTVQRPIQDITSANQNFDFPSEWFLALKWALVAELASDYEKTLNDKQYYEQKADILKSELMDWDIEWNSTFFQPDLRSGFNRSFR
jgi:hypothetical protein